MNRNANEFAFGGIRNEASSIDWDRLSQLAKETAEMTTAPQQGGDYWVPEKRSSLWLDEGRDPCEVNEATYDDYLWCLRTDRELPFFHEHGYSAYLPLVAGGRGTDCDDPEERRRRRQR